MVLQYFTISLPVLLLQPNPFPTFLLNLSSEPLYPSPPHILPEHLTLLPFPPTSFNHPSHGTLCSKWLACVLPSRHSRPVCVPIWSPSSRFTISYTVCIGSLWKGTPMLIFVFVMHVPDSCTISFPLFMLWCIRASLSCFFFLCFQGCSALPWISIPTFTD